MENEVISKFKIYILADTGAFSHGGRIYGFDSRLHKEFDSHAEALNWIIYEGERQVDYSIVEVIKKP